MVSLDKHLWTSHAEENAMMHAARIGMSLKGCTTYVTHCPCAGCTRALVQAGIMRVVFVPEMTSKVEQHYRIVVSMFDEAGMRMIPIGRDGQ